MTWYVDKLFPEEVHPDCGPTPKDCYNKVYAYDWGEGKALMTPDMWLEDNGLTIEDVINMLNDYPTTYRFAGDKFIIIPQVNAEYTYTDEITNTDQLLRSLLVHDPKYFGRMNVDDPYWRDMVGHFDGDKIILRLDSQWKIIAMTLRLLKLSVQSIKRYLDH